MPDNTAEILSGGESHVFGRTEVPDQRKVILKVNPGKLKIIVKNPTAKEKNEPKRSE